MEPNERKWAGRRVVDWYILLIHDPAHYNARSKVRVEVCEGATIITTDKTETAIDLLRTVAVDVIYNFPGMHKREEADRFRSEVAKNYPAIVLMDEWTPPSQREERSVRPVLPFSRPTKPLAVSGGECLEFERIPPERGFEPLFGQNFP